MDNKSVENIPADIYLLMFSSVLHWSKEAVENLSEQEFKRLSPLVESVFRNQMQHL